MVKNQVSSRNQPGSSSRMQPRPAERVRRNVRGRYGEEEQSFADMDIVQDEEVSQLSMVNPRSQGYSLDLNLRGDGIVSDGEAVRRNNPALSFIASSDYNFRQNEARDLVDIDPETFPRLENETDVAYVRRFNNILAAINQREEIKNMDYRANVIEDVSDPDFYREISDNIASMGTEETIKDFINRLRNKVTDYIYFKPEPSNVTGFFAYSNAIFDNAATVLDYISDEVPYVMKMLNENNIAFDVDAQVVGSTTTLAAFATFDTAIYDLVEGYKRDLIRGKEYSSSKSGFKKIDDVVKTSLIISSNIYSRIGIAVIWGFLRSALFTIDDFAQTKKLITKSEGFVTGKRNIFNVPYLGANLNIDSHQDFTFEQGVATAPASYYQTMFDSRFIIVYDELYKNVNPEFYVTSNLFNESNQFSNLSNEFQLREISKLLPNTPIMIKPFEELMNLVVHSHGIEEFLQRNTNQFGNLGFINVLINTTSTQCNFMHPAVLLGATLFEYSDVTISSLLAHHSASMLYSGFQEILRRLIMFKRGEQEANFRKFADKISSSESYVKFDERSIYQKSNMDLANKSRTFLQNLYDTIKVGIGDKITYTNSNVKKSFVSIRKPIMEYFANISDADSAEVVTCITFNKRMVEISEISIIQVSAFSQSFVNIFTMGDLLSLQMKTASELKKLTNLVSEEDRMNAIASLTRYDTKNKKSIEMGKSGFKLYPAGQWKRLDTKGKVTFQIEEPRTPFQIFMQTEHVRSVVKKFKSIIPGVDANSIITALWKHPVGPIWQLKDYCISKSMQEISDKAPLWTLYFTLMDLADYSKIDMIDRDVHGGLLIKAAPSATIMGSIINDYLVADMPTATRQKLFNEYNEHNNKLFKTMGLLDKTGKHFAETTIEPVSASSYGVPDFKKNKIKSSERPKLIKDSETVAMSEVGGALADYFSKNTLATMTKSLGPDNEFVKAFKILINVNEQPEIRRAAYDNLYANADVPELQHLKRYLPMMKSLLPIDNSGKAGKKVTLTPSKQLFREALDKESSRATFNTAREMGVKREFNSLMNLIGD